jgi:hypothetical protein
VRKFVRWREPPFESEAVLGGRWSVVGVEGDGKAEIARVREGKRLPFLMKGGQSGMNQGRHMLRRVLYVRGNLREIRLGRNGDERSSWGIAGG